MHQFSGNNSLPRVSPYQTLMLSEHCLSNADVMFKVSAFSSQSSPDIVQCIGLENWPHQTWDSSKRVRIKNLCRAQASKPKIVGPDLCSIFGCQPYICVQPIFWYKTAHGAKTITLPVTFPTIQICGTNSRMNFSKKIQLHSSQPDGHLTCPKLYRTCSGR